MNLFRLLRRSPMVEVVKTNPRALELAELLSSGTYRPSAHLAAAHRRLDQRMAAKTDLHRNAKVPVVEHYKAASSRGRKAALLERLVRYQRAKSILEVGTAYGASGMALALSQEEPPLVTIEFSPNQGEIGRANLLAEVPEAECIFENEVTAIPRLVAEGRRFDFVFHDAAHRGDSYIRAYEALLPALEPGALFALDDIQWDDKPKNRSKTAVSPITCRQAWEQIVARDEVNGGLLVNGRIGVLLL